MFEFDDIDISEKNRILKEYIEWMNIERKKIQEKFQFEIPIPIYILDEIIESKNKHREDNINALINLATINNRIDVENAKILKNEYVFHNNKNNIKI